jgi:hypothetical protein
MDDLTATRLCAEFCHEIGCSMVSPKTCPGDPHCSIVRKVMPPEILRLAAMQAAKGEA